MGLRMVREGGGPHQSTRLAPDSYCGSISSPGPHTQCGAKPSVDRIEPPVGGGRRDSHPVGDLTDRQVIVEPEPQQSPVCRVEGCDDPTKCVSARVGPAADESSLGI